jgi:hypothetical protein
MTANEKEIVKAYEKELKRLRLNNLRLKLHMNVLVNTPKCKTAEKIRVSEGMMFNDSIINLN